jgi:hypothetical protein
MTAIVTQSIDGQLSGLEINNVVVSPHVTKLTFPSKWVDYDITAFGSVGRRYGPSIDETKFTIEMLWNQVATNGTHTVVGNVHNAKTTVSFAFFPAGNSNGQTKINGLCSIPEYEITSQVGNYVKAVVVAYVDNGVTYSTI